MKKLLTLTLALALAFVFFTGCEEDDPAGPGDTPETASALYVLNGLANTLSLVDLETGDVYNDQVTVGEWPTQVEYHDGMLYVISTKFNNIDVIDPEDWSKGSAIELGDGNSPEYMVFTDATTAWVTANASNKVFKVNVSSKTVEQEVTAGDAPWGITAAGGKVYVTSTAFDGATFTYGQGTVTVIDAASGSVDATINVPTNPQAIAEAADGKLHVVCTGNYGDVPGKIAVIDPATNAVVDSVETGGTPGSIAMTPNGDKAYVGVWGVGVIVYNTTDLTVVHDLNDPLAAGGGAGVMVGPQGEVFTTLSSANQVVHIGTDDATIATYDVGDGPTTMAIKTEQ